MDQTLFTLADKLRDLREEKDAQTAILKDINTDIDRVEYELTEAMAKAECPNFTHNGKQFIMTTTTRWSAETDRKEELYAALRENGYDHLFTVNHQTLASFIKEQVNENAAAHPDADKSDGANVPEWLSGLVKSYDDIGITMKSATKKPKQ